MLKELFTLDIYNLNPLYSREEMQTLELPPSALPKQGIFYQACLFLYHLLKYSLRFKFLFSKEPNPNSPLFFFSTNNQKKSTENVIKYIKSHQSIDISKPDDSNFPIATTYILSIPFLPLLLIKIFFSNGYKSKSFRYNFESYWLTYGFYISSLIWLRKNKPSLVITTNDHSMTNRVICHAANRLKIPTIYFQHASISEGFPPLIYNYAFLDGKDSLSKYLHADPDTKTIIFLTGNPKYDFIDKPTHDLTSPPTKRIGICTNHLDSPEKIAAQLPLVLEQLKGYTLTLRPHPADTARATTWQTIANEFNIQYSNSTRESSLEFLSKSSYILASESSIVMEAALLQKHTIFYDFGQNAVDRFGFIKNGLIKRVTSVKDLATDIVNKDYSPTCRTKLKYFFDNINTPYEGKSASIISSLIIDISNNRLNTEPRWTSNNTNIYRLKNCTDNISTTGQDLAK